MLVSFDTLPGTHQIQCDMTLLDHIREERNIMNRTHHLATVFFNHVEISKPSITTALQMIDASSNSGMCTIIFINTFQLLG